MRVFQVAKELNVASQEILDALEDMEIEAKSNLAAIDDDVVAELRELFKPKPKAARPSKKEEAIKKALAEKEEREKAALDAARREQERKEAVRNAALAKAAARRAQQRAESGEPDPPLPEPQIPAVAETPVTAPEAPAAEAGEIAASASEQAQPAAAAEPAARKSTRPAPPPARPMPSAEAQRPSSRLGKAVIAPPPSTAKERAQLLGRPLGGRPASTRPASRGGAGAPASRGGGLPPRGAASGLPARGQGGLPPRGRPGQRGKKGKKKGRQAVARQEPMQQKPSVLDEPVGQIKISEGMTIKDLAERMDRKAKDVIKQLFLEKQMMATINNALDEETARWVVEKFGGTAEVVGLEDEAAGDVGPEIEEDDPASKKPRWPVVTMMGHVDHGKTSLLDAIREARVAEGEAGGITQHIGAYRVEKEHEGRKCQIVFLDTPGHEAFTLMRARGAQVTDIVVLVVAADDGVMPQTVEAIHHAQAAKVPLVIAVNKMDKDGANPDRVLQQLAEREVLVEKFGGSVVSVPVSAKARTGIEELLDMILLVSDMEDLTANPDRPASGTVLEAKLDRARGPIATVLVQNGTLKVGDVFVVGHTLGRVRALSDEHDDRLQEAAPSTPVVVMGLDEVPAAGDTLQVFPDEQRARQIALYRQQKRREEEQARRAKIPSVETLFDQIREGQVKELPIVLKADVQGSIQPIEKALADLSTSEVAVRVIHSGTGAVSESDILLAAASRAIVIGFNVRPERGVEEIAKREGVDTRLHTVIYKVADEIKQAMLATLSPVEEEVYLGRAEVREIFKISRIGTIAGCYVTDGLIRRDAQVRLLRDNVVVHEGKISSLKRFKDDAKEVKNGFECGITLESYHDLKPGDEIEAFTIETKKRESLEPTAS